MSVVVILLQGKRGFVRSVHVFTCGCVCVGVSLAEWRRLESAAPDK